MFVLCILAISFSATGLLWHPPLWFWIFSIFLVSDTKILLMPSHENGPFILITCCKKFHFQIPKIFQLGGVVIDISLALCKTAVSPLLTHWRYCSLGLSPRCSFLVSKTTWNPFSYDVSVFAVFTNSLRAFPNWTGPTTRAGLPCQDS